MSICFLCFPDDVIPGYARSDNPYTFQVSMAKTCIADPCCCLASLVCPLPVACINRHRALEGKMEEYKCCQGYYPLCGMRPGEVGESSCPSLCLCLEATCCFTCAVSATRNYLMDKYSIHPDPMDYQIVRCSNAIQCLSCICSLASICIEDLREGARILRHIAHITFCTVQGCMQTQTAVEIAFQHKKGVEAPQANRMNDRF
ncbi:splicing factor 3 subunit [Nannochloropsis oceanica]